MSITITRPIDEYTLKITITKLTLNEPLDDESFKLEFPDNIPVQKMP
jgi:outer membrane lipoprotein-sorting protein